MKRLVLPLILMLLGLAGGVGAGLALRPAPEVAEARADPVTPAPTATPDPPEPLRPEGTQTVRLPSQFLVPLIGEGRVRAMVVLGIALDILPGETFDLAQNEARVRALFLQLLFDYANLGGFDGVFTAGEQLLTLRRPLLEAARAEFGAKVHDVLIVDLLRQES